MKILGITAEYNPFHNGHKYHLQKSREAAEADCIVAVMSGNFTQRGQTAVLDKWTRSRLAVDCGVDLVLELPFVFACNRGEIFARGAVDILAGVGADCISFGSESGDLERLCDLAQALQKNELLLDELRRQTMKGGYSFAKSFQLAAEQVLGKEKTALMLAPNNILALEYLKRLFYWQEKGVFIEPLAIKRYGSGYRQAAGESGFAGAGAIREMLMDVDISDLLLYERLVKFMPQEVAAALVRGQDLVNAEERAFRLLRGEIVKSSPHELAGIYCIGEGLENKLKKEIIGAGSMRELITALVSRRYTEAAVRRMLTYLLVGIKEQEPPMEVYGRVLAANAVGRQLLKAIKKQDEQGLPIITNVNKDIEECTQIRKTLEYDLLAADMYNILADRDLYEFSDKVIKPYIK